MSTIPPALQYSTCTTSTVSHPLYIKPPALHPQYLTCCIPLALCYTTCTTSTIYHLHYSISPALCPQYTTCTILYHMHYVNSIPPAPHYTTWTIPYYRHYNIYHLHYSIPLTTCTILYHLHYTIPTALHYTNCTTAHAYIYNCHSGMVAQNQWSMSTTSTQGDSVMTCLTLGHADEVTSLVGRHCLRQCQRVCQTWTQCQLNHVIRSFYTLDTKTT